MKTAESKTSSSAASTAAKTSTAPFFSQEPQAESAFFGGEKAESESFFSPKTIQPKLTIGAPNDHYEQQADAVADQVVQKLSQPQPTTHNQQPITNNSSTPSVNGASTASSSTSTPSVQSKCDHCEQEEKLQKKDDIESVGEQIQKKPIFDSAAEPPPDEVQRKTDGSGESTASPDFANQLASSKGGGTALPPETQQQMGNAIGADFSGVRVHTGSEAAHLSENIGAQAFTHGNDVYFNEGKYNPSSTEGSRLLAHELTHTVQQGAAVKKKAELTPSVKSIKSGEKIQKAPAATANQATLSSEVVDVSSNTFNPSEKVKGEIEAAGDKGLDVRVIVKGLTGEGRIKIKMDSRKNFDSVGKAGYMPLLNKWAQQFGGMFIIFTVRDSNLKGGFASFSQTGTKHDEWLSKIKANAAMLGGLGLKVGRLPTPVNTFENGKLTLGANDIKVEVGGFVDAQFNLAIENTSNPKIDATADINVKGIAKGQLKLDNTKEKLTGEVSLSIDFKAFSGSATVKYNADGTVDIAGKGAYNANKLSGEIQFVATDLEAANSFAKDAIKAAGGKENVQNAPPPAPVPAAKEGKKDRALAATGQLNFNLTKWFAGAVTVVVDGKGDITVIGKIAPPAEIELFKQKDWDKELIKFEAKAYYGIPLVGNLNLFANISLRALAKLGPAKIYNIEILGTYSTDPEVQKSIQISASLNISAYAGLRLRAEGGAGIELLGHDLKFGVGLNADIGVKAYADARPTIGYREPGEFYVSGTLDMVAQPMLGLGGDFFIELDSPWWSPAPDKKWTWPLFSKEWPLSDPIGISASVKDYVLGSGQVPEVEMKKPEFDPSKFMTSMVDDTLPEKSGGAGDGKGTFKEDGSVPKPTVPPKKEEPKKGDAPAKGAPKKGSAPKGGKSAEPDAAVTAQQDTTKMFKEAAKPLEAIKGKAPLTRAQLNDELTKIQGKVNGLTFDVQAKGEMWSVTPKAGGKSGKGIEVGANMKAGDKDTAKGNDNIKNALAEIDTEGAEKIKDGEVTKQDADQIVLNVKRDHPTVIESISVKDGGENWDFEYVQKKKKSIARTNVKEEDIGAKTRDIISAPYGKAIRRAEIYRISQVEKKVYIEFLYTKNKEQIEFKDFKKQLANGTIKIANSEREYLMKNRPKYRAGVVEQVWANATSTRGRVFDPNPPRLELFWNKNQDRDTQWHMGHRHGKEYRKLVDEYIDGHIDYDAFLNDYNNPKNYYPEDAARNVSHQNEAD